MIAYQRNSHKIIAVEATFFDNVYQLTFTMVSPSGIPCTGRGTRIPNERPICCEWPHVKTSCDKTKTQKYQLLINYYNMLYFLHFT